MNHRDRANLPNLVRAMQSRWLQEVGAHADDLGKLQEHWAGATIPEEFLQFLRWSDGGRCVFPLGYLDLWPVASIITLNDDYLIRRYLEDAFIGIGTDGGSTLIALDLRPTFHGHVTSFDLGNLDIRQGKPVAESVGDLFRRLDNGLLTSDSLQP
ncbi:SMI1/KNR4 family protein [Stenotrophomonas sp. S41]|uniref:SMI1/KNR4 family protein n=1 Tax=Stenotrophomonas sp. S41 TaxID=2767464 RepID=UPI001909182B|nr:SMI1/KNR4 family protein [Stenotrophomonas sp. S41]MBK0013434.1 SMI1/KNR4 family protein [Stenotrophomonas sp. S41]